MSEINVTPFVDVMLVLLIVFMVTAPLLVTGVQVDLPESQADSLPAQDLPLAVTVSADGTVFVQEAAVDLPELAAKLRAVAGENDELRIFVRGDRGISYGRVMEVVGAINAAGFSRVALVSQPSDAADG
ncbi:MAG: ExbD/TolR family protein [Pseudomonadota bacterium]